MLQSMTGYANEEFEIDAISYEVELKSLNSKHCDIQLKLPEFLSSSEIQIRNLLKKKLQRGKIYLYIKHNNIANESSYSIDQDQVANYKSELSKLQESGSNASLLPIAMSLPGSVYVDSKSNMSDKDFEKFMNHLNNIIDKMIHYRKKEGELLESDIKKSIYQINHSLENIKHQDSQRIESLKARLKEKLQDIKAEVDENRYEQEILYYTEKIDINEEVIRLQVHLDEFKSSLENNGMIGKKLGFIGQEIGREINTIGSKANDSKIQHQVISMKEELEKIKEQTLNIF